MISVVMPAHNEARVIQRTLSALTERAQPGELEVIVVCNGCTDDTAAVARAFEKGGLVRVLESAVAGKAKALNLGDKAARGFPRVYIDADVLLSTEGLRQLAQCLEDGSILAAAPTPKFDTTGSAWSVRAYYAINERLPSFHEGIGGSGVYSVSKDGRARFVDFPDITADDLFVRLQFSPRERLTLRDCHSTVFAPKYLADLIAIKTRSHFGGYELHQKYAALWSNRGRPNGNALLKLWKNPLLWPQLTVYCYIKLVSRTRARRRLRRGLTKIWERDESSRRTSSPNAATKAISTPSQ